MKNYIKKFQDNLEDIIILAKLGYTIENIAHYYDIPENIFSNIAKKHNVYNIIEESQKIYMMEMELYIQKKIMQFLKSKEKTSDRELLELLKYFLQVKNERWADKKQWKLEIDVGELNE